MGWSTDPDLAKLEDEWIAAREAKIPDLNEVRAAKDRIITYLAKCVLEYMESHADPEPPELRRRRRTRRRLRLISNDGPVRRSPHRMSSPLKTGEIRAFEDRVNRVFGIDATATTEWPGEPYR